MIVNLQILIFFMWLRAFEYNKPLKDTFGVRLGLFAVNSRTYNQHKPRRETAYGSGSIVATKNWIQFTRSSSEIEDIIRDNRTGIARKKRAASSWCSFVYTGIGLPGHMALRTFLRFPAARKPYGTSAVRNTWRSFLQQKGRNKIT